jgi:hypothetical protein
MKICFISIIISNGPMKSSLTNNIEAAGNTMSGGVRRGVKVDKSALLFEMEHVVPESMQMSFLPGLMSIRQWLSWCNYCQAHT